jgi:hypothetical protein
MWMYTVPSYYLRSLRVIYYSKMFSLTTVYSKDYSFVRMFLQVLDTLYLHTSLLPEIMFWEKHSESRICNTARAESMKN